MRQYEPRNTASYLMQHCPVWFSLQTSLYALPEQARLHANAQSDYLYTNRCKLANMLVDDWLEQ